MNLWIRSQDKSYFIPIKDIISEFGGSLFYKGIILGDYKTKERALEVLDEIQKYMTTNAFAKIQNVLGEDLDIKPNPIFVYEMPKE